MKKEDGKSEKKEREEKQDKVRKKTKQDCQAKVKRFLARHFPQREKEKEKDRNDTVKKAKNHEDIENSLVNKRRR